MRESLVWACHCWNFPSCRFISSVLNVDEKQSEFVHEKRKANIFIHIFFTLCVCFMFLFVYDYVFPWTRRALCWTREYSPAACDCSFLQLLSVEGFTSFELSRLCVLYVSNAEVFLECLFFGNIYAIGLI